MKKEHHRSALVDVRFDELRQGDYATYTAEHDPRGKGLRAPDLHLARSSARP